MKRATNNIQRHSGIFDHAHKRIPFYFWSNTNGTAPDTLLLLGAGQINQIPKWVAVAAGHGVVVAQGLPYWHSSAEPEELENFVQAYCHAVLLAAQKTFGVTKWHLVAESQATPGAIHAALDFPEHIQNVAFALPMGLTTHNLGNTPEERFEEFKRRSLHSLRHLHHSPISDPRNLYIWLLFARLALSDKEASERKYALGVSYDATELLRKLAIRQKSAGHELTLLLGANDQLFKPAEILAALKKASIPHVSVVTVPDAGHTSLGVRAGRPMLAELIKTVRK
jgi:pimeloyl-ACP methyl ester carboxylesterase